jgi:hypothetical protein
LWVLMDIGNQLKEVGIRSYCNTAKWSLEQSSTALIGSIDRPGIGIEQVREVLAWGERLIFRVFDTHQ